jgi:hypothetical protein
MSSETSSAPHNESGKSFREPRAERERLQATGERFYVSRSLHVSQEQGIQEHDTKTFDNDSNAIVNTKFQRSKKGIPSFFIHSDDTEDSNEEQPVTYRRLSKIPSFLAPLDDEEEDCGEAKTFRGPSRLPSSVGYTDDNKQHDDCNRNEIETQADPEIVESELFFEGIDQATGRKYERQLAEFAEWKLRKMGMCNFKDFALKYLNAARLKNGIHTEVRWLEEANDFFDIQDMIGFCGDFVVEKSWR